MNTLIAIAAFQCRDGINRSLYRLSTLLPDLIIRSFANKLDSHPHAKLSRTSVLKWLAFGQKRGEKRLYFLIMEGEVLRGIFSIDMSIDDLKAKKPMIRGCHVMASDVEQDIVLWAVFELFNLNPDENLGYGALQGFDIPDVVPDGTHRRFLKSEAMVQMNRLQDLWIQKGRDRGLKWKRYAPLREQIAQAGVQVLVELGHVYPGFEDVSQPRYEEAFSQDSESPVVRSYITDHGFYWPIDFRDRPFGFTLLDPYEWTGGGYRLPKAPDPLAFLVEIHQLMEESQYEAWYREHVTSLNPVARTLFDVPYESFDCLDTSVPYLWDNEDFIEYCKSMGVLTEK